MSREKQLEHAVVIVSTALVSLLIIVWDILPPNMLNNVIYEVEKCLGLIDRSYTVTLLADLEKIKDLIKRRG